MSDLRNFVALDLETTGLKPSVDQIIELGAVLFIDGVPVEEFSKLVKPIESISSMITNLTGITNEMVESSPAINEVIDDYIEFIIKAETVIGHNVEFDLGFIRKVVTRKISNKLTKNSHDTVVWTRALYPRLEKYSLSSLISTFQIKRDQAHRALADSLATGKLFVHLVDKFTSLPESTRESLGRMLLGADVYESVFNSSLELEKKPTDELKSDEDIKTLSEEYDDFPDNVMGNSPSVKYDEYIPVDTAAVENHFLPGGLISKVIDSFEYRSQQGEMAVSIASAFNRSEFLLVEAPTGVGKSVAYLVPAAWWASLNNQRVIISTQTKSLQWQLFYKDIPQVQKAVNFDFKAVLLKGRGNYLCLYKYYELKAEAEISFNKRDKGAFSSLLLWVEKTKTGDISECHGFNPNQNQYIWSRISCEGSFCLGYSCQFADRCYLLKVKKEAQRAQVVVVNHYLTFADFSTGGELVRDSGNIIFDEAHNLEKVAASYLGKTLDKRSIDSVLTELFTTRPAKGGFLHSVRFGISQKYPESDMMSDFDSLEDRILAVGNATDLFFEKLTINILSKKRNENAREISYTEENNPCDFDDRDGLIIALRALHTELNLLLDKLRDIENLRNRRDIESRLDSYISDIGSLISKITDLTSAEDPEYVYWAEMSSQKRFPPRLHSAPLKVGELLDEKFYPELKTAIFTSATMTVNNKFNYVAQRLGVDLSHREKTLTLKLDSPFDINASVAVITASYLPTPKSPDFESKAQHALSDILTAGAHKAMVLFTSYNSLKQARDYLQENLEQNGYKLFVQNNSYSSDRILKRFKKADKAILFGTDTFWEGIDLPGDLLELLVLYKLPFTVPDRPWFKENLKRIEENGQSAFAKLSLPDAVVKFRQGFGRLIRTANDRGCVVALDSRLVKSSFGRVFLNSVEGTKFQGESSEEIRQIISDWLNKTK